MSRFGRLSILALILLIIGLAVLVVKKTYQTNHVVNHLPKPSPSISPSPYPSPSPVIKHKFTPSPFPVPERTTIIISPKPSHSSNKPHSKSPTPKSSPSHSPTPKPSPSCKLRNPVTHKCLLPGQRGINSHGIQKWSMLGLWQSLTRSFKVWVSLLGQEGGERWRIQ